MTNGTVLILTYICTYGNFSSEHFYPLTIRSRSNGSFFIYVAVLYYNETKPLSGSCTVVDYIAPENIPYFGDCEPLIKGLGYSVVELAIFKRQSSWQVKVVITGPAGVGIADCTKVHRALLPRLEAILSSQDMYVEVTSPGLDRVLKNAAEFDVFTGKMVKVWNTDISDWIQGVIRSSGSGSVLLDTESGEMDIPFSKIAKAKLFDRA